MKEKQVKCDCGEVVSIPHKNSEYNIMDFSCPHCGRKATHGNCRTGEVFSWMTQAEINDVNDEFRAHQYDADMNELFGRGNW